MEGKTENGRSKLDVMKEKMMNKSRAKLEEKYQLRESSSLNKLIKTVDQVGQFYKDLDYDKENRKIVLTGPHQGCLAEISEETHNYTCTNSTA